MNHKRKLVECLACVDESRAAIHCKHQDMFREVVRRFVREELAPQQKAFEEAGQPSREIWRALGKMVCCYEGSQSQCYPHVVLNEVYADNDTTIAADLYDKLQSALLKKSRISPFTFRGC